MIALSSQPMTPEEIADLVARVRVNMREVKRAAQRAATEAVRRKQERSTRAIFRALRTRLGVR